MIYLQLFWSFLQVGLFSIGGGYAAIPFIQRSAVEGYGWLGMAEFTDLVTIAEMTPGPITVNAATFVGNRMAGLTGAAIATFGCVLPSMLIVSLLAYLYFKYKRLSALQSVLSSLRPVVVALIASAGLSILQTVLLEGQPLALENLHWIGAALFAAAFVVLRKWKWNPILVMVLCGLIQLAVEWMTGI